MRMGIFTALKLIGILISLVLCVVAIRWIFNNAKKRSYSESDFRPVRLIFIVLFVVMLIWALYNEGVF